MTSQTLLPMPPGIERIYNAMEKVIDSDGADVDLPLKTAIESSVIQWGTTVNDVLQQESTVAFTEHPHPTPKHEVEFWKVRLALASQRNRLTFAH